MGDVLLDLVVLVLICFVGSVMGAILWSIAPNIESLIGGTLLCLLILLWALDAIAKER
jgi:hypothetical protein